MLLRFNKAIQHGSIFLFSLSTILFSSLVYAQSFGSTVAAERGSFSTTGTPAFDDWVIGAPFATVSNSTSAGIVRIRFRSGGQWSEVNLNQGHLSSQFSGASDGGSEAGDGFGFAVTTGDFNGDGRKDLAIGAPFEDIGSGINVGCVHVLYGSATPGPLGLPFQSATAYLTRASAFSITDVPAVRQAQDRFGTSLAAGDFNGDGLDDLAIGATGVDAKGVLNSGAVFVFKSGGNSFPRASEYTMYQGGIYSQAGTPAANEEYGTALAVGNFNGDKNSAGRQLMDLAVGAPRETVAGDANAGNVTVMYGRSGARPFNESTNLVITQDSHFLGTSSEPNDFFGEVLVAGNFDGPEELIDQFNAIVYDDLAIGSPYEDWNSTTDAGVVQVLYGSAGGITSIGGQWFIADTFGGDGVQAFANFGLALAAGDVINNPNGGCQGNSCNPQELIIGEPYRDVPFAGVTTLINAGLVYLLKGNITGLSVNHLTPILSPGGVDDFGLFGRSLAVGRIETASGEPGNIADIIIGQPGENSVAVIRGAEESARSINPEFEFTF